ncbi:hypothetical protein [Bradyrhizobium sp. LMG 9283]|uniref:hypothetical protein n=1 Tax=Bradyrhizobium sp. LMG 9283 TaxID=592064 RepID=UPI00388CF83E
MSQLDHQPTIADIDRRNLTLAAPEEAAGARDAYGIFWTLLRCEPAENAKYDPGS